MRREFAGQGLPGKVLDYVRRECARRGVSAVRLDTGWEEERMRELYQRLGFTVVRRRELPGGRAMALYELRL